MIKWCITIIYVLKTWLHAWKSGFISVKVLFCFSLDYYSVWIISYENYNTVRLLCLWAKSEFRQWHCHFDTLWQAWLKPSLCIFMSTYASRGLLGGKQRGGWPLIYVGCCPALPTEEFCHLSMTNESDSGIGWRYLHWSAYLL